MNEHPRGLALWTVRWVVPACLFIATVCWGSVSFGAEVETETAPADSKRHDLRERVSFGAEAETEGPPRLILDLKDGSRVLGRTSLEAFSFQSAIAKVKIPFKGISAIEFKADQETATVRFQNGDHLQGVVALETIELETVFGKVDIPLRHLSAIVVEGRSNAIAEGLILRLDARLFDGEKWPDQSSESNDGVNHNAAKTSTGGILFNGVDSTVTIPRKHALRNFTVSLWARKTGTFSHLAESIFSCGEDGAVFIDYGGNSADNAIWRGVLFTNTGTYITSFDREKFSTRWIQFAMVYDGNTLKLYQNGVLCHSTPANGTIRSGTNHFVLGQRNPGSPFYNGSLGDVLLYDRALSDDEIERNFKTSSPNFQ